MVSPNDPTLVVPFKPCKSAQTRKKTGEHVRVVTLRGRRIPSGGGGQNTPTHFMLPSGMEHLARRQFHQLYSTYI